MPSKGDVGLEDGKFAVPYFVASHLIAPRCCLSQMEAHGTREGESF